MSTLKSINVIHPSGTINNIVNDASGNVAVGNNLTVTGTSTLTGATTVGGVAVVAVAPGTSGNVLKSNGTIWQSAAPASTASLTLLATLTTTSGTTQSATGLATTYTYLLVVFNGVNNSTGADVTNIEASVNNGSTWGTLRSLGSGAPQYGSLAIYLANSSVTPRPVSGGTINASLSIATTAALPINALRFSYSSGYTFNAGAIYIYGVN